jgi:hypothetical protein
MKTCEKVGEAWNASPTGILTFLLTIAKTLLRPKYYKPVAVTLLILLGLAKMNLAKGTALKVNSPPQPQTVAKSAEIKSPRAGPVAAEVRIDGTIRGIDPDESVYIESRTQEYDWYYRQVSIENNHFWYDNYHPGKKDSDFGKKFTVRIFIPKKGVKVDLGPQKVPLEGTYISDPVVYVREPANSGAH